MSSGTLLDPIIGPTMMIMVVLPVLSLTVEVRDRSRRPAIPVAGPVRYLVGHARLSATASWTLLWSSRSASILSAQNCIKSMRSGRRSSRS